MIKIFYIVKLRKYRGVMSITVLKELSEVIDGNYTSMEYDGTYITAKICTLKVKPKMAEKLYRIGRYEQSTRLTIPSEIARKIDGTHLGLTYDAVRKQLKMKVLKFN